MDSEGVVVFAYRPLPTVYCLLSPVPCPLSPVSPSFADMALPSSRLSVYNARNSDSGTVVLHMN